MTERIGIFGGTFDPIHCAHLYLAENAYQQLGLEQILFIPNYIPVHRGEPCSSSQDRLAMLQRAIADQPHFRACDIELRRQQPSYMIDTLQTLMQRNASQQLYLIIGADSLQNFPSWHRWQDILQLSQLAVLKRPNHALTLPRELSSLGYQIQPASQDPQTEAVVWQIHAAPLAHSATELRRKLRQNLPIATDEIPKTVLEYIQQQHLYT